MPVIDSVNSDQMRIIDTSGCLRLPLEAGHELLIFAEISLETLDRHVDLEGDMLSSIDDTHASPAKLFVDDAWLEKLVAVHFGSIS